MKKLMFAAALAAVGSAFAIESANVVGYTTLTIESKYQIIGVNFQAVDGTSLKLNDMIPYQEGMTKGNKSADADQIQIGNETGGWAIYYLSNGYNAKGKAIAGLDGKWAANGAYTVADVDMPPGTTFWYVRKDATKPAFNLSIAGSVTTLPSADYSFASKFRIFSNPYTVDLAINDAFPYNPETMTAGNKSADADQIQIGNATGGWAIYYLSNGYNAKGKTIAGLEGKWAANGAYTVSDAKIPVGKSAWYVRKDATKPPVKITLTKPYDL